MTFMSPLRQATSLPLRVAVYSAIADAIRNGELAPGQVLPPEATLGEGFGVSRTVIRESLILLEEDGLILTKRGIGRFVTDVLPPIGLERLLPIERMLDKVDSGVAVKRLKVQIEQPTDFTRRLLSSDEGEILIWESVVFHTGTPVALSLEWIPALPLDWLPANLGDFLGDGDKGEASLLARLMEFLGTDLPTSTCEISASTPGQDRAHLLGVSASSPVLVLTQSAPYRFRPFYLAKHLIRPEAGHLTVVQTNP